MDRGELKNFIVHICTELKRQQEENEALECALNKYFDSDMCVPILPDRMFDIVNHMWVQMFEPTCENDEESWLYWFVYEDSFGKDELDAWIDEHSKEYTIDSIDSFAEFMCDLLEHNAQSHMNKSERDKEYSKQDPACSDNVDDLVYREDNTTFNKIMSIEEVVNKILEAYKQDF